MTSAADHAEADARAHFFAALDLLDSRNFAGAETRLREALRLAPDRPSALTNLALALLGQDKLDEAAAVAERAVAVDPANVEGWLALGKALSGQRQFDGALAAMNRAVALAPRHFQALVGRATVLSSMRRFEDAIADYEAALAVNSDDAEVRALLFSAKLQVSDWRGLDDITATLLDQLRNRSASFNPHILFGMPSTPADHFLCAQRFAARHYPAASPLHRGESHGNARLRVAYVSGDFREHPTSQLLVGTFEHHDRERFETIGISFGPDDGSALRKRVADSFDAFIDVRGRSDDTIARVIHDAQADIAVDLGVFTTGGRPRIFAQRPAPIQVNYLVYAGTGGAAYLDYIVADRVVIPENERQWYAEQVVWLPHSYFAHDDRRRIAPDTPSRHDEGLPETGFVFGSFNNARKLLPHIFAVWMDLLRAVDGSVLWLLQDDEGARARLRNKAAELGVAPDRLVFARRAEPDRHLARQRLADLLLDCPVRNAHTTACDALWAGVPLLTQTGATFPGRVATSILLAAGLPELVTQSEEEYVAAALSLARGPAHLAGVRAKVAAARSNSPLFDTACHTRHLESAYRRMTDRRRAGLPPEGFAVGA